MSPDTIINDIIRVEGSRYTNDPADSGGPTKYGITQAALAEFRGRAVMPDEVAALTEDEARRIYFERYWLKPRFDLLMPLSKMIATEVMDSGVNCGTAVAAHWLQRLLNVLNDGGRLYGDLVVDGKVGPATAGALASYLRHRGKEGERVLFGALNGLQVEHYTSLAERRPKDERFVYGWFRERVAAQLWA